MAKTLFEWLQTKHPGKFDNSLLRSLKRGVKRRRATEGEGKEVFFSQVHEPGRLCASDFSHMTSSEATIGGQAFNHLVYHFVLTAYSNWESITICFSESFESLSEGIQNAVWELGGVAERHRTDRMSLAVNNASNEKEFTGRYTALLGYYKMAMEKIQPREANENGDVEQSHRRFKEGMEQALLLRGHRDFESRESNRTRFLRKNYVRAQWRIAASAVRRRIAPLLRRLPERRLESCKREASRVDSGSLIRADRNTYSVRRAAWWARRWMCGCTWSTLKSRYAQKEVERFPRLRGRRKHNVNYRHIIDCFSAKTGCFCPLCLQRRSVSDEPLPHGARCSVRVASQALRPGIFGDCRIGRGRAETAVDAAGFRTASGKRPAHHCQASVPIMSETPASFILR